MKTTLQRRIRDMAAQIPVPGCARHPGKVFLYVCMDCNEEFACMKCIVDVHKNHNLNLLDNFEQEKRQEIERYIDILVNKESPKLRECMKSTDDKISENSDNEVFRKQISDLKQQAQKLKDEVDRNTDRLVGKCTYIDKRNKDKLKSYKSSLQSLENFNNATIRKCHNTLKKGTNVEVIQTARETTHRIWKSSIVPGNLKTVKFISGPATENVFEHLLCNVTADAQDEKRCPADTADVLSKFTYKWHIISCLVLDIDHAWLSCWKYEDIYKVDGNGNVKEKIDCRVKVTRIAISPTTGRIWLCCNEDKSIREVMDSITIETRFITDNRPSSLCILHNNMVVVGMNSIIRLYTTNGEEVQTRLGDPCRQEATTPISIAHCPQTGDIVAVDIDSVWYDEYIDEKEPDKTPHVKVMDKYLTLKFQYPYGNDQTKTDSVPSKFYPHDACFNKVGDMLIADCASNSIVMVDGHSGKCIRVIYTDVARPLSVNLQGEGTIWVGLANRKVKVLRYKY